MADDVTHQARTAHPGIPLAQASFDLCGLRVWVGCLPAEGTSGIGGDWYLAVADDIAADGQPGAILGVGDVAGHGPTAAAAMTQLRNAVTSWISTGTNDPADLLRKLNRLCVRLGTTATAALARFDPGTRVLTWAQAGHPPPLLARAGRMVDLERPPGLLLGAVDDSIYRSRHVELAAADLMLLYTDGLIDGAAGDRQGRVGELCDQLASMSAAGHDRSVARLQFQLDQANPNDDACLMAARLLS